MYGVDDQRHHHQSYHQFNIIILVIAMVSQCFHLGIPVLEMLLLSSHLGSHKLHSNKCIRKKYPMGNDLYLYFCRCKYDEINTAAKIPTSQPAHDPNVYIHLNTNTITNMSYVDRLVILLVIQIQKTLQMGR